MDDHGPGRADDLDAARVAAVLDVLNGRNRDRPADAPELPSDGNERRPLRSPSMPAEVRRRMPRRPRRRRNRSRP